MKVATLALLCAVTTGLVAGPARAQEFSAAGAVGSVWTDNVFLMHTPEWDVSILPSLKAGMDFGTAWTLQYDGAAEIFTSHTDLTSHDHALRLQVNPAFGPDGRNEFLVALAVETLRNQAAYDGLNFVGGTLNAAVSLEPATWVAWQAGVAIRYRGFYDDRASDALDVLATTEVRFTLPSRTTLTPRLGYGFRYNLGLTGPGRVERDDHQVDVGLHISQGLWAQGGLQADYSYRYLLSSSQALARKLTQTQFAFLTSDFLAGGHRAYLKYKQLLPRGWSMMAGLEFRTLEFPGWPATDLGGTVVAANRKDQKLIPMASLGYTHAFGQTELTVTASYSYIRQWSNAADYDTHAHQVGLNVGLQY
jgi:hypothetical protein